MDYHRKVDHESKMLVDSTADKKGTRTSVKMMDSVEVRAYETPIEYD